MLADSETYFVSQFQVYLGKETDNNAGNDDDDGHGLDFKVINSLGRLYFNCYRHFCFDNFFSSIPILQHLLKNKTYACSTVRHNRKQFPADLKNIKLKRGEIRT